jgi:hypothetical protein
MPNQLQTREYWRTAEREQVEQYATGRHTSDTFVVGLARAELARRDQEWSEEQEADRRAWEAEREQSRRQFETELAEKQLRAAADVAKATKQAMIAAFAAAFGAIVQAAMAVAIYLR